MKTEAIIAIVCAVFASTGFWTLVNNLLQNRSKRLSAEGRLTRSLAHDRICELGKEYIAQGYISPDDFHNLHDYLYMPYLELGGNGVAKRIMEEVKNLPLKEDDDA